MLPARAQEDRKLSELSDEDLLVLESQLVLYLETLDDVIAQNDRRTELQYGAPLRADFSSSDWSKRFLEKLLENRQLYENFKSKQKFFEDSNIDLLFQAWEELLYSLEFVGTELGKSKNFYGSSVIKARALLEISSVHLASWFSLFELYFSDELERLPVMQNFLELEALRKEIGVNSGFLDDPIGAKLADTQISEKEADVYSALSGLAAIGIFDLARRIFRSSKFRLWRTGLLNRQSSHPLKKCVSFVEGLSQKLQTHKRKIRLGFMLSFGFLGGVYGYRQASMNDELEQAQYQMDADRKLLLMILSFHRHNRTRTEVILETYLEFQNEWRNHLAQTWVHMLFQPAFTAEKKLLQRWDNLESARNAHMTQLQRVHMEIERRN